MHILKWKYIDCKKYAVLAAMIRKQSYFVKNVSSRSPGLECSYEKIFIPVTEISGPLHMSPVNRAHMKRPRDLGNRDENFPI